MLLLHARQVTRHVLESHDGNIERIAEPDETTCLVRRVAVQHTRQHQRLVGDKAHRLPVDTAEAHHDVLCEILLYLEEIRIVRHRLDNVAHVIRLRRISRQNFLNVILRFRRLGRESLCLALIVPRNERQQLLDLLETLRLRGSEEMRIPAHTGMHTRSAQVLRAHHLTQNRLHHIGTRDEHLRNVIHHEDKVRQCRRIHRPTGTRSQNHRQLRNHARSLRIAEENLPVTRQRVHTLLDTRSARIVDTDDRNPHLDGMVHNLRNLTRVHQSQRTACHRKILCINSNRFSVYGTGTDNDTISVENLLVHTEIFRLVLYKNIVFMERTLIQDTFDTLAGCHLTHLGLLLDGIFSTTLKHNLFPLPEVKNIPF